MQVIYYGSAPGSNQLSIGKVRLDRGRILAGMRFRKMPSFSLSFSVAINYVLDFARHTARLQYLEPETHSLKAALAG